jgi:tRNA dimethylallyltransferase
VIGDRPASATSIRHLAIVGATATGKTALAVALARAVPRVELVSVDAMAVYRHMDIGTAKPSASERSGIAWHLLDLVEPEEEFSVSRFQAAAATVLEGIEARGHVGVLVGGTGLYHRSVVDGLAFPTRYPEVAAALAAELAGGTPLSELYGRLLRLDPIAASRIEPGNARRILRALEVCAGSSRPFSSYGPGLAAYPPTPFSLIGLRLERTELARRIAARLDAQLAAGFLDEVRALLRRPAGLSRTASQALGYRELASHLRGEIGFEEARAEALSRTRNFARRQESWFRRDPRVHWVDAESPAAFDLVLGRAQQLLDAVARPGG